MAKPDIECWQLHVFFNRWQLIHDEAFKKKHTTSQRIGHMIILSFYSSLNGNKLGVPFYRKKIKLKETKISTRNRDYTHYEFKYRWIFSYQPLLKYVDRKKQKGGQELSICTVNSFTPKSWYRLCTYWSMGRSSIPSFTCTERIYQIQNNSLVKLEIASQPDRWIKANDKQFDEYFTRSVIEPTTWPGTSSQKQAWETSITFSWAII